MSPEKQLIGILEEEREHLLSGNLDQALSLADGKIRALDRLETGASDGQSVALIKELAARNAELIASAKRGFVSARETVSDIPFETDQQTYSQRGTRYDLEKPGNAMSKRL